MINQDQIEQKTTVEIRNINNRDVPVIVVDGLLGAGRVELMVQSKNVVIEKKSTPATAALLHEFSASESQLDFTSKYNFQKNTITTFFNGASRGTAVQIDEKLKPYAQTIQTIVNGNKERIAALFPQTV